MAWRVARTGIAVLALAVAVVVPAQKALAVGQHEEVVITYYSDAQLTTVIGEYAFGCTFSSWGSTSSYHTTHEYSC